MHAELQRFIEHAREKGMDHATIRMLLLTAGWKEKDIARGLAEQALELPVPAPPDAGGARDAFLHLLAFAAFYTAVISVGSLLFGYIDALLPDPAVDPQHFSLADRLSLVRSQLATVMVSFPLLIWFSRRIARELRAHPERAWSGVRRWLIYLTLFTAALVLGGDVITLVTNLLEGELSLRFLSKVVVVLVLSGLALAYFFLSLRLPAAEPAAARMHRAFGAVSTVIAVGAVAWGMVLTGSPGRARLVRFDDRRIDALKEIRSEVRRICLGDTANSPPAERKVERPLPASLDEVVAQARMRRPATRDPQTGEAYEYEVTGETTFRVCAAFAQLRDESWDVGWNHPGGRHCFDIDVLADDLDPPGSIAGGRRER